MAIDGKRVLRLNLPVWQGGDRPNYRIGGRVLAAIAPDAQGPEETVPVPRATADVRPVEGGIVSRGALLDILAAARAAIERHAPDAIVALGGDCFVDLAPFAWLSERYGDELAVLWVDAHPDVMGAAETASAHAHVVALLVGEGDPALAATVRRPVDPERILYVGLGETSPAEADFIRRHGIASLPGSPGAGAGVAAGDPARARSRSISTSTSSTRRSTTTCCSTTPRPRPAPTTRCRRAGCGSTRSRRSCKRWQPRPTSSASASASSCPGR